MTIRQLPAQLANQIAAGEVVERPSSVVKELVENSIDAGADQLFIDIEQGGAKRIRIRDNGGGIEKGQLSLALSRHATSKIESLDDLEAIASLGFRGEALASISSVARLTLTSKPPQQAEAWQAFCEGRDMAVAMQPAAHPDGTTVDVQDLFFNTPARRKFMRTEKTEFSHIDEVLKRIALASPAVRIQLTHNQRKVRDYRPARNESQHVQRLKAVVGATFAKDALALEAQQGHWALRGWVAPPGSCRHQNDIQYMYVNGRMMKDKLLNHAIRQAYGEQLADDRQPTFVLYLTIPPREVDVNVHPAKHEVRFHQARQIHDYVLQVVRDALQQVQVAANTEHAPAPATGYQPPPRHFYTQPTAAGAATHAAAAPSQIATSPSQAPGDAGHYYQRLMTPAPSQMTAQVESSVPAPQGGPVVTGDWQYLTLLEQRYVLLKHGSQLAMADVNRLHALVVQQQLQDRVKQGLSGQPLLLPVQLQLPTPLLDWQAQQLAQLGVQLKLLAKERVIVMQVPAQLRQSSVEQSVVTLLSLLDERPLAEQQHVLQWLSEQGQVMEFSTKEAEACCQKAAQLDLLQGQLQRLAWEALWT